MTTPPAVKWTQVGRSGWLILVLIQITLFSRVECRPQTGQETGVNVE
ncbi:unnamed protein product [Acanthoscelides obtectus]|uniref:Uncharacterized protein n=1 Tax=Acanthoscelides obtectus TaxID=200917 RepID=A0A9P0PC03_ACAOB|nr:unnamed protein product [Acanthoscelides obtectus]CAK1664490.1 hypothetical protein AOBTE_LOCUS24288 [Acanthoscelides obtectus]